MTTPNSPLPTIDLKKARDPAQRLAVAKQLVEALETVGFLFVDNAEGYDPERLLNHARWFFNLSQQERFGLARKLWNSGSKNHYRGYFPTQIGESSFKEGFEIGQEHPPEKHTEKIHPFFTECNLWPDGVEGAQQFREDMIQYFKAMHNATLEILHLLSLGCGLEENWFESMFFPDSLSTLRLLHYPPRFGPIPDDARDGDIVLCCNDHSDTGFVTLLATFNYGGLEIYTEDGEWMAVPCRPQSLVMNIGELMSIMSGGKFKSTRHRVVDTNIDRLSVPFFLEPRYDADVSKIIPVSVSDEQVCKPAPNQVKPAPGQLYGSWLIDRIRRFAEYREILDTPGALQM